MKKLILALLLAALATPALTQGFCGGGGGGQVFALNISGPEFATPNFPSTADWNYLQSKGVKWVRLPTAWENWATTPGGALQTTYRNNVIAALNAAAAHGIKVIVDLHNFGCYAQPAAWGTTAFYAGNAANCPVTNVNVLGDATLTQASLATIWTNISTVLVGNTGLGGYEVMNEPTNNVINTNLAVPPNYFLPPTTWSTINASVVTQLAAGTNPLGAAYGPAWSMTSGTGFGGLQNTYTLTNTPYTLSAYCQTASGTDATFTLSIGGSASSFTCTTSWQRFSRTVTPTAGSVSILAFLNEATGHTVNVANVQLENAGSASAYQPNIMSSFTQAAINAIRAVDTAVPIYVDGIGFSGAANWTRYNYELNPTLLTDSSNNLVFEPHSYFDGPQCSGGGGSYSGSFTSYGIDTQSGVCQLTNSLTAWAQATGSRIFIGEFNITNVTAGDANTSWFPLQGNFETTLRGLQNSSLPMGSIWYYGANGCCVPSNILNVAPVGGVDDPRLLQMLQ